MNSYEILPRPIELGSGWRLRLLENDKEVGGGIFPPPSEITDSADALQAAFEDAEQTAYAWLDAHDERHISVTLNGDELMAVLPDGRTLIHADPIHLARLLRAEGVRADEVQMPDWRDGNSAPLTGQKIALLAELRKE